MQRQDPDFNFYLQVHDCEYYTECSLSNRLVDLNIKTNNRGSLALLHLNIPSISYKLDRFSNFWEVLHLNFLLSAFLKHG